MAERIVTEAELGTRHIRNPGHDHLSSDEYLVCRCTLATVMDCIEHGAIEGWVFG